MTTVTRMGGEFLLGLSRAVRDAAGAQAGDTVVFGSSCRRRSARSMFPPRSTERSRPIPRPAPRLTRWPFAPQGVRPLGERGQARETRDRQVAQALEDDPHRSHPQLTAGSRAPGAGQLPSGGWARARVTSSG